MAKKAKSVNRKNVENPNEENTLSTDECKLRAGEKGFGDVGAHRCNEEGDVGPERKRSKDWIEKQHESVGATNEPAGEGYRTQTDG